MNEVMLALEAMIRRIVREEMLANLAGVAAQPETQVEFNMRVKEAVLDQTWFDNAIKAEVATAVPVPIAAQAVATPDMNLAVLSALRDEGLTKNYFVSTIQNTVRDDLIHSSAVHDRIVEVIQDTSLEMRRDFVQGVIADYDFSDIVNDGIEDYDFSDIVASCLNLEDEVRDCVRGLSFSVSVD